MNEEIDILLSRYFSGEASDLEKQLLDDWLAESEENEAYFEKMTMLYQQSALIKPMPEPDIEKAFASFKNHIAKEEKTAPKIRKIQYFTPYIYAAACFALAYVFFKVFVPMVDKTTYLTAENVPVQKTIFEGVDVLLDVDSEIKYNPNNENQIALTGKATFTVNSSENDELVVLAGNTLIKDIGTVFTVIAHHPEDSVVVEVTEGEILFYTRKNSGIVLKESEKGIYYTKENYFERVTPLSNIKAIEFEATPLSEVMEILSAQYKVSIAADSNSIDKMQISVSFDPNESIDNILAIISETLSLEVRKESNESYILSYFDVKNN